MNTGRMSVAWRKTSFRSMPWSVIGRRGSHLLAPILHSCWAQRESAINCFAYMIHSVYPQF
jgi:hypothetical protein